MKIFYFKITPQHAPSTEVAIFAENADNASTISGNLMLNIERYEPRYSGAGLSLFQQSGTPQQLLDAVANATIEGVGGYTLQDGWTITEVAQPA